MMQAVTNLKNAVTVLSKHQKSSNFLQLDSPELASVRAVVEDASLKCAELPHPIIPQHKFLDLVCLGGNSLKVPLIQSEASDRRHLWLFGAIRNDIQLIHIG